MTQSKIYFVRHAQGYHNISQENINLRDPDLTAYGIQQCKTLEQEFPHADDIDLIVASPMRRTLYTALQSFEKVIKEKKLTIIALPELQETSTLPCDTGSSPAKLAEEFKDQPVDLSLLEDGWYSKKGKWASTTSKITARAHTARLWLRNRPEKNIAVVTHGGLLHYLTEDWTGIVDNTLGTGWANTEWRSYQFLPESGDEALLEETQDSRERRRGLEIPLCEAEQRNLREVIVNSWEELGFVECEDKEMPVQRTETAVEA